MLESLLALAIIYALVANEYKISHRREEDKAVKQNKVQQEEAIEKRDIQKVKKIIQA